MEIQWSREVLPLSSIKSYFSRRTKKLREGKTQIGEVFPVTNMEEGKGNSKKCDDKQQIENQEPEVDNEEEEGEEEEEEEEKEEEEEDEH